MKFTPIKHRRFYLAFVGVMMALSVASIVVFGLKPGIDFTGGAIIEVVGSSVTVESVEEVVAASAPAGYSLRTTEGGVIVRTAPLDDTQRQDLTGAIEAAGMSVSRLNAVGPTLGSELAYKSVVAMTLVIAAVLIYVAIAFAGVREPVGSWTYGTIVVVSLVHDILIPLGLFAALGAFAGFEVDSLFVTALLVILGYSINDTIVIFDRVRENLRMRKLEQEKSTKAKSAEPVDRAVIAEEFPALVERSVRETLARSLNTSITTALSLAVLYFVGAESTQTFALALFAGVIAGAWSSLFLAAPLLVIVERRAAQKAARAQA